MAKRARAARWTAKIVVGAVIQGIIQALVQRAMRRRERKHAGNGK
jgi:hypothetical protein